MCKTLLAMMIMGCIFISSALGGITYVDAELNNTTIAGSVPVDSVNCTITSTRSDTDGLWAFRTDRSDVNGNGIWVTDGGNASGVVDRESTEALKVIITLPTTGIFNLYAVIMNNNAGSGHWDVAAMVGDAGNFITYNKYSDAMTQALSSDFNGSVTVSGGDDRTMKVLIGEYTATTAGETVDIYINGLDGWDTQTGLDQRTRFDGIGYEKVSVLPTVARNVSPEDGTTDILGIETLLEWNAANNTDEHNVYLSNDEDLITSSSDIDGNRKVDMGDVALVSMNWQNRDVGTVGYTLDIDSSGYVDMGDIYILASDWLSSDQSLIGTYSLATLACNPGVLSANTTYYWRVDEVDGDSVKKGDVWEFTTFNANGLTARVYNDMYLSDLVVTRIDSQVNFDWGNNAPATSVDADEFSILWEGGIMAPTEGEYTFYTNTDDGVRLWVNDILIIDYWRNQSDTEYGEPIYLKAGMVYPIRMEYYENAGSAAASLSWSGPGVSKEIIPTDYLTSSYPHNLPKDIWVINLTSFPVPMRLVAITLQGLVAKDEPTILMSQGGLTSYIRDEMEAEGTVFHDNTSVWWLLEKYKDDIQGIILCGSDLESRNAATSLCGPMRAIAVDESILDQIQDRTNFSVLADVRDSNELDIYNTYADLFGHEVVVDVDKIDFLRDISVTRDAFTFYDVESDTRVEMIDGLTSQGMALGWGSNAEYGWVEDVSLANACGVPADWCKNLSILSKLRIDIPKPPRRYPAPVQEGERIIAFSMSDGDNLQIMAGGAITSTTFFGHEARGTFPMSWEFPPSMAEFNPRGVRSFYGVATTGDNLDCFIAGPSGHGYAFHYNLPGPTTYAMNTGHMMQKCGLTVASMINPNAGSMSDADELLDRPEILGVAYKDWVPYDRRGGAIHWHNGKPAVSYKCILWDGLGSPEEVAAEIQAMPTSPATNQASYGMVNANAWSFGNIGGPMQAIVNTIELLPENTRLVTVEELIILLRNNFGDPITEEEYYGM